MTNVAANERCGYPKCGHSLGEHSEDGYCWTCAAVSTEQGAHAFQTQPSPSGEPCACCGETRPTVKERFADGAHLCDECELDSAIAYIDCKHGYDEASPVEKEEETK
jgi:hypothetical protein